MDFDRPTTRSTRLDWLLWWRIDQDDLEYQVAQYSDISIWESMRGNSMLFLLLSAAITIVLVALGGDGTSANAYVDVVLFVILALFIYFGHRWAMIVAMVLWTLEKALVIVGGLGSNVVLAISQILWWAVYMHAFYFAFRIEQKRHKSSPA